MCVYVSILSFIAQCVSYNSQVQSNHKSPYNTIKTIFLTVLYLTAGSYLFCVVADEKSYKGESEDKGVKGSDLGRRKRDNQGKENTNEEENVCLVCMEKWRWRWRWTYYTHRCPSRTGTSQGRQNSVKPLCVRETSAESGVVHTRCLCFERQRRSSTHPAMESSVEG